MVELRPLIVVTGTIHVEGGEKSTVRHTQRNPDESSRRREDMTVTLDRQVTPDRRAANVITTDYMRRLRSIVLLRTEFGALVDPARLPEVKALIADSSRRITEFNSTKRVCRLSNCALWERLVGNRLVAVSGWIDAHVDDEAVKVALPQLVKLEAA